MLYLSGVIRSDMPDMPVMVTPHMWNRLPDGVQWAADNGRFAAPDKYRDDTYLEWLAKRAHAADRCLFATAPDTYGDHEATLRDSLPMLPRIQALGFPAAFVAQPGANVENVPWDAFDVLFIGGPWRGSEPTAVLAREAKRRGKWVHLGRVNSRRWVMRARAMGCDSVDGTSLKYESGKPVQDWAREATALVSIWGGEA